MVQDSPYLCIVVESYRPKKTSGRHGQVHIRPIAGQGYSADMHVQCSKSLSENYPLGTLFRIKAKLNNKEGSKKFLSSHYTWDCEVIHQKCKKIRH